MSGAGLPEIGIPDGAGLTVAVVTSRWNEDITGRLQEEALAAAAETGATARPYVVVGALEIPVVVQALATEVDAIGALGCVIRGGTPHFDYVCDAVTAGLTRIALDTGTPIGNGVLTCDTHDQALARSGAEDATENKGRDAMIAAVHTADLPRRI
ncbi:6,7-dimethyl-8-ribityllumazine synthase [Corynebacterium meridianum]|uniref:6,7-dimethyl-8-ribityllumazine synthase n=1 Tax=Corynebacterium meridianum TaxID=2765363 RepID=A0A934I554_9CORY|nr:6,7-dimethyl-8-ribityllumazine synthase [Corynebacterium meridianum]MBI8988725.1 6,7-dimethyl-8-ribityllumazine synthase [Corynebacterium meridianum]MCK7677197.1 6,7-dimethyl-8-ribityllumazine synthase [Corynebacterium meridianum]